MSKYVGAAERVSDARDLKYLNALKVIQNALEGWAYCGQTDNSFAYFVDGVIQATDDWSDEDEINRCG